VIDTHCHLTFPDFEGQTDQVVQRARDHQVAGLITICTTTQDAPNVLAMARRYPNVWCSTGVHPSYADQGPHQWNVLRMIASDPKCVAWGELGLDNHYSDPSAALQRQVLDDQLAFILSCERDKLRKPIVLHCREAFDDLIPVLRATGIPGDRFVFHCFTGNAADVRKCLDFGALVSFTGVVTYRNARTSRKPPALSQPTASSSRPTRPSSPPTPIAGRARASPG
jgi:TatD DNase family protein